MSDPAMRRSDWLGGLTGILVFLFGIGILIFTFYQAFTMFSVPPSQAIQVGPREPVELGRTAESFVQVVQRILLLLVMSAVGSVIANRGIRLYGESRGQASPPHAKAVISEEPGKKAAESPRERGIEPVP